MLAQKVNSCYSIFSCSISIGCPWRSLQEVDHPAAVLFELERSETPEDVARGIDRLLGMLSEDHPPRLIVGRLGEVSAPGLTGTRALSLFVVNRRTPLVHRSPVGGEGRRFC